MEEQMATGHWWDSSTTSASTCISQKREFPFQMKPFHFELTFQTKQEKKKKGQHFYLAELELFKC